MMSSPFPPHAGGMQQHPGMPHGQPMGPAQVPHPGQPMQIHPGTSGPHGQQTQAGPMMGMAPGMNGPGGPSAHAMSHLAPGAAQMMQQGFTQQHVQNPALVAQYQAQQRMFLQRQHQMQQMQRAGMPMAGQQHPGYPGLSAQQLAAMQASGAQIGNVNLPPHLQQQMQMAQMSQQQQQQHQQQQQAAAHHAHQQSMAAQQQQQQQHMAMQHAVSQNSNPGQPTSQPGQPGVQGPIRPPTAMGTSSMESHSSPAPTSGPHQGQQPGPPQNQPQPQQNQQPAQPQMSGPQMQPAQTQSAQPQQTQQLNPQQQGQQQQQGQPGQPQQGQQGQNQQQQGQQPQQRLSQGGQNAMTQAAAAEFIRRQQAQAQNQLRGSTLLKVFNFADKLGAFRADQKKNDMNYWRQLIQQHFTEDGIFRVVLKYQADKTSKAYEVTAAALPRYFYIHYETEVDQIQLLLDGTMEKAISETHQFVQTERARMIYWFRDGTQLIWNGKFTALYVGEKIDTLSFETKEHITYLPRSRLEELCQASPDQNKSPRMTKTTGKQRGQLRQQQNSEPTFNLRNLPKAPVSDCGVTPRIQTFLELGETLSYMQDLMFYSKDHPELSVPDALSALVQSYSANAANSQAQMNSQAFNQSAPVANGIPLNPSGQFQFPPGSRTPNGPGSMQQRMTSDGNFITMSPAMQHSLLPGAQANGSPHGGIMGAHTPSPHQSNMAPPMAPQLSQQGSATGASANTSPNVPGKRRRSTAQGVKAEGDDGGGNVNGVGGQKVKQSPRMSGAKRMKNG